MIDYSIVLVPMITLCISQMIIFDLARFRFSHKKLLIIVLIELMILLGINGTILIFGGIAVYARLYVIIIVLPAFITFLYISKRRDSRDLFTILTTIFISFLISIPSMWFSRSYHNTYLSYNLARIVIFIIIFFLLHKFIRKYYLLLQDEVDKGWIVFSILPIIGSLILYYSFLQYGKNGSFNEMLYVGSVTTLVMGIVFGVIIYMFNQLHQKYIILEQQRMLSMQNKAQLNQFLLFKDSADKSNRRWHDLRHNTQTMIELLESGNTHTAIEYLKDQMHSNNIPKEEYCEHTAVNSILCFWAEQCRKKEIAITIMASVPQELTIESMELAALFGNAIENAYNSCLDLWDDVDKFIKIESHYNGKRLAIGVTNTCKGDIAFEDNMPISHTEGGGIGTRSMVYTVKRFHGAYTFSLENGLFYTRFVLNV